jgi:hypothetical protein
MKDKSNPLAKIGIRPYLPICDLGHQGIGHTSPLSRVPERPALLFHFGIYPGYKFIHWQALS